MKERGGGGGQVNVTKILHLVQELFTVSNNVISLMPVDICSLFMTLGTVSKVMKPSCSLQRGELGGRLLDASSSSLTHKKQSCWHNIYEQRALEFIIIIIFLSSPP